MTSVRGSDGGGCDAPSETRARGAEVGERAGRVEPHARAAWHVFLSSLATDADHAAVAAHLYAELPGPARDAWLEALAEDAPDIDVPSAALYGPLLAVEDDPTRRARIHRAAQTALGPVSLVRRALMGTGKGGLRVAVIVIPLYLDFVRVLVCRFVKDCGFDWVRQDPIVHEVDAPTAGSAIDGLELYTSTREAVVDELAHAVLAHRRQGRELPRLLCDFADLFSAALVRLRTD